MYALTERTNAVLFGAAAINIYADAGSEAGVESAEILWRDLIGAAKEKDELLFAGLKMLQIHIDRIGAMLTEALSRASSEWSPEGPIRKKPKPSLKSVGFSSQEAHLLDKFYDF